MHRLCCTQEAQWRTEKADWSVFLVCWDPETKKRTATTSMWVRRGAWALCRCMQGFTPYSQILEPGPATSFVKGRGEVLKNENMESLVHKTGKTTLNGTKIQNIFFLFVLIIYHCYLLFKVIRSKENFNSKFLAEFYCSSSCCAMLILNTNMSIIFLYRNNEITQFAFCSSYIYIHFVLIGTVEMLHKTISKIFISLLDSGNDTAFLRLPSAYCEQGRTERKELWLFLSFPIFPCHYFLA